MSDTGALSREEAISQFCGVTGADEERAKGLLEACDWNLELAVNMHVDTDDGRNNKPSTSIANGPGPSTSGIAPPVVTLSDSIDEGNDNYQAQPPSAGPAFRRSNLSDRGASSSGRSYVPSFYDPDNVRPPIPPVRQVLVQNSDGYSSQEMPQRRYNTRTGASSDVYDAFRDFQAEAQWQERVQDGESSTSDSQASEANRKRTLQELFRPPLEIMYRGSLESARDAGTQQNKWLLVNVQNGREFACQILNRDVWSNQTVKDILKEHFIFWQVYHDSFDGSRYIQFYNVSSFPHVSIIDPRTGEQMKTWPVLIDHNSFCDSVIEFLADHAKPDGSSDANTMKRLCVKDEEIVPTLYDQSEEAQLEAAIRASLQETTENSNSSKAFADEDSYTDAIESDNEQTGASNDGYANNIMDSKRAGLCGIGNTLATSNNSNSHSDESYNTLNKTTTIETDPIEEKEVTAVEDYTKYLGIGTEEFSDLVVRFPDGSRDQFKFPSDSLMKALFLLLTSRGYGMDQYYYVTNFPKRRLNELSETDTLHDSKLIRETIFIERKVKDEC